MKHYGDITKIKGSEVPLVDIVCGGSPCQDLSVAGKRAGLVGERSGLFMDQIRIIKEMRDESSRQLSMRGTAYTWGDIRPRYMVWENVPGAFSSNKGEDFRAVLEETAKIVEKDASIPGPPSGKWPYAGCIVGDGWSVAWRVHDAQFWGVPQRRRRICMLADFSGDSAGKILFELQRKTDDTDRKQTVMDIGKKPGSEVQSISQSVPGDTQESGKTGESATGNSEECTGTAISFQERAGKPWGGKGILIQDEHTGALSTLNNQSVCYGFEPCAAQRLNTEGRFVEEASPTLRAEMGDNQASVVFTTEMTPKVDENGISFSLRSRDYKDPQAVVYGISSDGSNAMRSDNPHSGIYEAETSRTLDLNGGSPACNQGGMAVVCLEGNGSRDSHKGDGYRVSETMYTLNTVEQHAVFDARGNGNGDLSPTITGDHQNRITDYTAVCVEPSAWDGSQVSPTLTANNANGAQRMPDKDNFNAVISYGLDRAAYNQGENAKFNFAVDEEKVGTCVAKGSNAVYAVYVRNNSENEINGTLQADADHNCNSNNIVRENSVVRRLTPLECERLQGFPDGWTDIGEWIDSKGKKHKDADSPRYKALGNSIALPFWEWMAERMVKVLKEEGAENPTMASLFDGIGGFPLVYSRQGCKPVWASEIEEFPIAVTKIRFSDKEAQNDRTD